MNEPMQKHDNDVPFVSVVIPTCNRREILERCLDALVKQTYPRFEVIVVDDGSTDDTPEFLDRFGADHPELAIRILRNESSIGANPSRNRGIRESGGEFVAFEDSDCMAEQDWIEQLVAGFASEQTAAVTGLVVDPKPSNIFELTFKGTHRIGQAGPAGRLIAGNMCVRTKILRDHLLDTDRATPTVGSDGHPDVSVSGRGDEEGLFLMLRAGGHEILAVPRAVVFHEHHYSARTFFRQAFRGGRSAAKLVYKYYLPQRLDLLPFMVAYVTLPLVLIGPWFAMVPAFFFVGALAAITYNDLFRKGKTVGETLMSFPVLLAYYQVRLCGYVVETIRLRLGLCRIKRTRLGIGR